LATTLAVGGRIFTTPIAVVVNLRKGWKRFSLTGD
jgi:hypothetical protein